MGKESGNFVLPRHHWNLPQLPEFPVKIVSLEGEVIFDDQSCSVRVLCRVLSHKVIVSSSNFHTL